MKHIVCLLSAVLMVTACHKKENETVPIDQETVLVYIAADNTLNDYLSSDLNQMIRGSRGLTEGNNLLLFIDKKNMLPGLFKIEQDDTVRLQTLTDDPQSSDPSTLGMAMNWAMANYPARNYGLVLWGHADGWVISERTTGSRGSRHAFGQDTSNSTVPLGTWMNIPDMAAVLEQLPCPEGREKPLRFILADCCCFQSVESAYELRNCTDYIIASAAEIPGDGAPYQTVIPALFSQRDDFAEEAAKAYYAQLCEGYQEPISVIETSQMEQLAQATATALQQSLQPLSQGYPDVDGLIYYYDRTLFDMNDFMLRHADSDVYSQWKRTFDAAVIYKAMATVWMAMHVAYLDSRESIFRDFDVTEERYGGVNMFVPQDVSSLIYKYQDNAKRQNEHISEMKWYQAAGLDRLGW